jgi:hypothetical protein
MDSLAFFLSSCWELLKGDLIQVVHHFYCMNQQDLHYLNQPYVVLVPKNKILSAFLISDLSA